jgi:hypothetical protein
MGLLFLASVYIYIYIYFNAEINDCRPYRLKNLVASSPYHFLQQSLAFQWNYINLYALQSCYMISQLPEQSSL